MWGGVFWAASLKMEVPKFLKVFSVWVNVQITTDDWTKSHFISARGATELMQSEESHVQMLLNVSHDSSRESCGSGQMLTAVTSIFVIKRTVKMSGKSRMTWQAFPNPVFMFCGKSDASHCSLSQECHQNKLQHAEGVWISDRSEPVESHRDTHTGGYETCSVTTIYCNSSTWRVIIRIFHIPFISTVIQQMGL